MKYRHLFGKDGCLFLLPMKTEAICIKNMVCQRCIWAVEQIFKAEGVVPANIELGKVTLPAPLTPRQRKRIEEKLQQYGFEVINNLQSKLVEQIRVGVLTYVRHPNEFLHLRLSAFLQDRCHKEYSSLSKLFTQAQDISIEQYYILQRVEWVKELLLYNELTVSEIANKLCYSSVAHLSRQFKQVTGLTPTAFKESVTPKLQPLDKI